MTEIEIWLAQVEYVRYAKELRDRTHIVLPPWEELSQLERDARVEGLIAAIEAHSDIETSKKS